MQQIRCLLIFFCPCKPLNQNEGVLTRKLTIVFPFQAGKVRWRHGLFEIIEKPKKQFLQRLSKSRLLLKEILKELQVKQCSPKHNQ